MSLLKSLLGLRSRPEQPEALYAALMAQARRPDFYRDYGVPDTLDGRFDLLVLHVVLLLRRLREDEVTRALAQDVFDVFFRELDRALREMGVGDLGVPRRVKTMAEVFYGRARAYDAALASGDPGALERAKSSIKAAIIGYGLALLAPVLATVVQRIVGA